MAKKSSIKDKIKKDYDNNKEKIFEYLMDFVEFGGKSIIDWLKKVANVKKKIRKVVVSSGVVLAALIVLIFGLASYLATFVSWPDGLMHILVGFVSIVLAGIYVKI